MPAAGGAPDGSGYSVISLHGADSVSQLILGREGEADPFAVREGGECALAFSFYIQLLDDGGGARGLWSGGEAMGGDRFLAPVSERAWHDVVIRFRASSERAGCYEVFLDGQLVDARSGVSLIATGGGPAQIALGIFRDGELVQGTSEIRFDAVRLGEGPESVLP